MTLLLYRAFALVVLPALAGGGHLGRPLTADEVPLVGRWSRGGPDYWVVVTLRRNGALDEAVVGGPPFWRGTGTWRVERGELVKHVTPARGGPYVSRTKIVTVTAESLILQPPEGGEPITYTRDN